MAKQKKEEPIIKVTCGECRRFVRDTSGNSYNAYTREYFMGLCSIGLTPDTKRKQFANKPRTCNRFLHK